MSDRLRHLVRDANPAQDPEAQLRAAERHDLFAEIERRTGLASTPLVEVARRPSRRLRLAPALAAGAAIIGAVAVAIVLIANNDPDATAPLPAPGESSSPTAVVNAFYAKWNERDIGGALAYLHPDARQAKGDEVGSVAWWDNYLNYSVAAYGGEWRWLLRDCTEMSDTVVQCRVGVEGEPLLDARAVPSVLRQLETQDGFLRRALVPTDVTLADIAVDQYAKRQDPEGHASVCGIEGRDLLGEFVVYDRACGEFIAPYRLALAAELLAP